MAIDPSKFTLYEGTGEWSALYEDGKIVTYGDHENVHEKLFNLLGIDVEYTDDFVHSKTVTIGSGSAVRKREVETAYDTIEEIDSALIEREAKMRQAEELREQAAELIAQANRLEKK